MDYGKSFEKRFKIDWINTFPNSSITRLYDTTAGYKTIKNKCDFICYVYPFQFFIECKAHAGASLPLGNITQYEDLVKESGKPGIRAGIILWLYEKDKVYYVPIQTIKKLKENNIKSVGLKTFNQKYDIIEIPAKKLVRFMQCDFSCMMNLEDGQ